MKIAAFGAKAQLLVLSKLYLKSIQSCITHVSILQLFHYIYWLKLYIYVSVNELLKVIS